VQFIEDKKPRKNLTIGEKVAIIIIIILVAAILLLIFNRQIREAIEAFRHWYESA
jgi:cell division protein FtsL